MISSQPFGRLGLVQLDSVNVLCRSHYLPLFARLGRYDRSALDRVTGHSDQADGAGDRAVGLRLVEYWAHQASLIPAWLHPLFRWRMGRVDQELWAPVVKVAREQPDLVARALRMVQERGADTGQRDRHRPAGGQARPGQTRACPPRRRSAITWSNHVEAVPRVRPPDGLARPATGCPAWRIHGGGASSPCTRTGRGGRRPRGW
jgi:hypothetical protein